MPPGAQQSLHTKVFGHNRLVLTDEVSTEFVQNIPAAVADLFMDSCYTNPRLLAIPGTLELLGQALPLPLQLLAQFAEGPRVSYLLPLAGHQQTGQPQVHAHLLVLLKRQGRQGLNRRVVYQERHMPPPTRRQADSHR